MAISIRAKLFLVIVGVTLVFAIALGVIMNNMSSMSSEYKNEVMGAIKARIGTGAARIDDYMNLVEAKASDIARSGESYWLINKTAQTDITDEIEAYVVSFVQSYANMVGSGFWYEPYAFDKDRKYYGPYAYWENGKVVFTMVYNTEEYDYHHQNWYTAGIPADWDRNRPRPKKVYWSEPFLDTGGTMALMVTVSGIMYGTDGSIIGLSTFDVSLDILREQVRQLQPTPSSTAFAIETNSGLIAAHSSDQDLVLKPMDKLAFGADLPAPDSQRESEIVVLEEKVDGRDQLVFYTVTGTGMGIGVAVPKDELFARQRELATTNTMTMAGVGLALALLLLASVLAMNRWIVSPIRALAGYSRKVADGDFNASIDRKLDVELATLHTAMTDMVGSIETMMREAKAQAEEARRLSAEANKAREEVEEASRQAQSARRQGLLEAAGKLQRIVEGLSSASSELAAQIDESQSGAETQASRIRETATAIEQMSASVAEIARNAEQSAATSESTRDSADNGARQVASLKSNVENMSVNFAGVYESVSELNRKAEGIGAIAQTIEDIADQTNLLALNAAIEAARAGDAGRGFAVVADEVRKLAEKTMAATKEVGGSIQAIQKGVGQTLTGMDQAKSIMDKSSAEASEAAERLRSITSLAMSSSGQVRAIATASEEQASVTEEIERSIEEINVISTNTATAMAHAAHDIGELNGQAVALRQIIEDLRREGEGR